MFGPPGIVRYNDGLILLVVSIHEELKTVNNMEVESAQIAQAADLYLFLIDRPLHPELFRHFADYRVRQARYHADVWITGLSHVITMTCGSQSLSEVVAPETNLTSARGVLTRFRMKGERDLDKQCHEEWNYMVSTQVEGMDEALYKSVHDDLVRYATRRGWFCEYEPWGEGNLLPFTYIDHEARDREFHVHAFHAFPHERTIVKTQTIIELPPLKY
jgi:hypothetical protein